MQKHVKRKHFQGSNRSRKFEGRKIGGTRSRELREGYRSSDSERSKWEKVAKRGGEKLGELSSKGTMAIVEWLIRRN